MSAPVSQSAQLRYRWALTARARRRAACQHPDDGPASRLGVTTVLLQHSGQVLSDELRTRDAALASGAGEEPIVLGIEGDRGRLLPCECHGSNMTRRVPPVSRADPIHGRRHLHKSARRLCRNCVRCARNRRRIPPLKASHQGVSCDGESSTDCALKYFGIARSTSPELLSKRAPSPTRTSLLSAIVEADAKAALSVVQNWTEGINGSAATSSDLLDVAAPPGPAVAPR